ncbi:MAG: lysine biosynthesis protein LysW, partial [Candidatus Diapherotrites archaeon]|nr:lysine biosynthesis protein LysW [Candidatus Diapherotrites archaeon]
MAECPLCAAEVKLNADVEVAEIISCSDCGADLEVKSVSPVKLAEAP